MALLLAELAVLGRHGGQVAGVGREKGMGGVLVEGARRGVRAKREGDGGRREGGEDKLV
jgi:hypothetical protein